MNVNESAAASTKVVGAAAIISRALYRVLTAMLTREQILESRDISSEMETEAESHWIMLLELILCRISEIGYICEGQTIPLCCYFFLSLFAITSATSASLRRG